MNATLLLCSAVEDELAALLPSLTRAGGCWQGRLGRLPVLARAVGVGPVEAALGSARALEAGPAAAIFVGTCGAFPGTGIAIGAPVVIERAVLTAADAAAGLSYIPAPAQRVAAADPALCAALGGRRAGAATVVAITRDATRAAQLRDATSCETEHLEAYAFLRAAELAGVPAACVLGVANEVGPDAHAQWRANGAAAAAAAMELVAAWAARAS